MRTKSETITGIAAGILLISMLALASTAAAEVVYTPVNVTISGKGSIKFDLNHDRLNDFVLHSVAQVTSCGNRGGLKGSSKLTPVSGDGVVVSQLDFAAVLASGIPVDGNSTFYGRKAIVTQFFFCQTGSETVSGYLGLEFLINGQVHYGWAQIYIHASFSEQGFIETTLVDFAYETIPGQAIKTGQTS
jgi:hypothetical protein